MINNILSPAINSQTPTYKGGPGIQANNQVNKPAQDTFLTNEATQRILNDKIIDKLDKILEKNKAESVKTLNSTDYTPDAVSTRILNFIQEAINRAGSRGENQQSLFEQAKAGVDQGFKDAKNILDNLNALSGTVANDIQKTYDLIQNGLKDVLNKAQNANNQSAPAIDTSSYTSATSQSLNLEIKTKEGDTLTLNVSRDAKTGQYTAQISNPNGEASYTEKSYELNNNFSLSIQGNLNENEMAAVKDVLSGVKDVADEFFNGNSKAALEAGLNLGYNTNEIVSFSLSLNESKTTAVTKAYQDVSNLGSSENTVKPETFGNLLKPLQNFLNSLNDLFNQAKQTGLLDDPKSQIAQMLEYFANSNNEQKSQLGSLETKVGAPLNSIASDMLSKL